MNINALSRFCFWVAIACVLVGAIIGLVGIWVPRFFESELSLRCFLTDVVLFLTASSVSAIASTWFKSSQSENPPAH